MPRVPTVSPQPNPSGDGIIQAPGVVPRQDLQSRQIQQFGQTLQAAGSTGLRIAADLQGELDNARYREAFTLFDAKVQEIGGSYLNSVGKDAVGANRERVEQRLNENLEELENGLDNDTQRFLFRQAATRRLTDQRRMMDRHEATQLTNYNIGQSEALIQQAQASRAEMAARLGIDGQEPEGDVSRGTSDLQGPPRAQGMKLQENTIRMEAHRIADLHGLGRDDPQRAFLVRQKLSEMHRQTIERLVAEGRGGEAGRYLQGVPEEEMLPGDRTRMLQVTRRETLKSEAGRDALDLLDDVQRRFELEQVDDARALLLGDENQKLEAQAIGPLELEVRAVREINEMFRNRDIDADKRDIMLSFVEEERVRRERVIAQAMNDTREEAERQLINDRLLSVDQLPSDLHDRADQFGLLPHLNNFANSNYRHTTNERALSALYSVPTQAMRRFTAEMWRNLWVGQLNPNDLKVAMAMHARANEVAEVDDDQILSRDERIRLAAFDMGVIRRPSGPIATRPEEGRNFLEFQREIQGRLTARIQSGEPDNAETLQSVIDTINLDRLFLEFVDPNDPEFREGGKLVFMMTEEEKAQARAILPQPAEFFDPDQDQVFLNNLPGTEFVDLESESGLVQRIPNLFAEGSVRGSIIQELRNLGLPVIERNILRLWRNTGRPKTQAEFEAAVRALETASPGRDVDVRRDRASRGIKQFRDALRRQQER